MNLYRNHLKRILDAAIAGVGLVVTSPLQLMIAGIIRHELGRPVLFRQCRPGRDGRPFELVKFRTMLEPNPELGLLDDDHRLTNFGRFLRQTSLDELPTLWNVVRGEMSLVGPRPLLMEYLEYYDSSQARRHEERPGVTGLAQVNGRNAATWEKRFDYDVEYVDNVSARLDFEILMRTMLVVLRRDGISAPGHATMPRFKRAGR